MFEITLSRGYGEEEFREDLRSLYNKLGIENKKVNIVTDLCFHQSKLHLLTYEGVTCYVL